MASSIPSASRSRPMRFSPMWSRSRSGCRCFSCRCAGPSPTLRISRNGCWRTSPASARWRRPACIFFLYGTHYLLGGALFLIANLAFGASVVFCNAFLPEIARAEERDRVSSMGWAIGYLGGGSLLALNLMLFTRAPSLGLDTAHAVRINFASTGLWWACVHAHPARGFETPGCDQTPAAGRALPHDRRETTRPHARQGAHASAGDVVPRGIFSTTTASRR